jgi:hypothetical protein
MIRNPDQLSFMAHSFFKRPQAKNLPINQVRCVEMVQGWRGRMLDFILMSMAIYEFKLKGFWFHCRLSFPQVVVESHIRAMETCASAEADILEKRTKLRHSGGCQNPELLVILMDSGSKPALDSIQGPGWRPTPIFDFLRLHHKLEYQLSGVLIQCKWWKVIKTIYINMLWRFHFCLLEQFSAGPHPSVYPFHTFYREYKWYRCTVFGLLSFAFHRCHSSRFDSTFNPGFPVSLAFSILPYL